MGAASDMDKYISKNTILKVLADREPKEKDWRIDNAENTEFDGPDEEFDACIADKMKELERYWKKAIIVYVNN